MPEPWENGKRIPAKTIPAGIQSKKQKKKKKKKPQRQHSRHDQKSKVRRCVCEISFKHGLSISNTGVFYLAKRCFLFLHSRIVGRFDVCMAF